MTSSSDFDYLDAISALISARGGLMAPLSERVRSGADLYPEERRFIADLLVGQAQADPKISAAADKLAERLEIGKFLVLWHHLQGGSLEDAIDAAELESSA